jgi:VCBS repeat-containing protein
MGAALALNPDKTVQYDPTDSAALQALTAGQTAEDTFTYTIRDSLGGTDTAIVTVTVTGLDESGGSAGSGSLSVASFDSSVLVAVAELETGDDAETTNRSINTWARDVLEFEPSAGGELGHNGVQRARATDYLSAQTRPMLLLPPGYQAALDRILEEESGSRGTFTAEWARPNPFDEAGAESWGSEDDGDNDRLAEDAADAVLEAFGP